MAKLYGYLCEGNKWLILEGSNRAPVPGKKLLELKPFKDGKEFDSSTLANEKEVIAAIAKDRYCVVEGAKIIWSERTATAADLENMKKRK